MPRERVRTDTVFKFDELSESAQNAALDKLRGINVDHDDWAEFVLDDAKACGAILGIDVDKFYYSGFSSQGDGACFTGSYRYVTGALAAIKKHAPLDTKLHDIAARLVATQQPALYSATASVAHRDHYYHSGCTSIDVECERGRVDEQEIKDTLRTFMDWTYRQLEKEYEYLTSDEQVRECIEANEYEFTEEGRIV